MLETSNNLMTILKLRTADLKHIDTKRRNKISLQTLWIYKRFEFFFNLVF